jgi:hypothetical protein
MRSKLATDSKSRLLAQSMRLGPERRLEAFLTHSRLMTELYRAGSARRKKTVAGSP